MNPVVLVTTADMHAGRDAELMRLVASVEAFCRENPQVCVHHVMLLQRCNDAANVAARLAFPARMDIFGHPAQIPLSQARNIILNRIQEAPPFDLTNAIVAFPDDDAWYPDRTLAYLHSRFGEVPSLDLWFCRYGSRAEMPSHVEEHVPTLGQVVARASSNTMAVRGSLLQKLGGFDENLGLGTPARSGEDTDFAIRAALCSRTVYHAPYQLIGHRDFDTSIRARYYAGTLVALGRHKLRSKSAFFAFARKLLVGVALFVKADLPFSGLIEAWRMYRINRPMVNTWPM